MQTSMPSFANYFAYFLIVTSVLPTLYFYYYGILLSHPIVTYSTIVSGYLLFLLGFKLNSRKRQKMARHVSLDKRYRISTYKQLIISSFVIAIFFLFLYPLRVQYNIGVPNSPPSISYAGWIYYSSTYGIQTIIIAAFLLSKQKQTNFIIFATGLSLYAIIEALLGWRTALLEIAIILFVSLKIIQSKRLPRSPDRIRKLPLLRAIQFTILLGALYFLVSLVLQLQLDIRNPGTKYGFDQIAFRFWGANYLDNTVSYFVDRGYDVLTNNHNYLTLIENNMSVAEFNNQLIVGIGADQHQGNSKSGFGSLYIIGGLLYVMIGFFFTGIYFAFVNSRFGASGSIFWTTLFLLHFPLLFKIINEQFEVGTLKILVAIWIFSLSSELLTKFFAMPAPGSRSPVRAKLRKWQKFEPH